MNTSAKLVVVSVCVLGVAAVVGIPMSRPFRTHDEANLSARIAPAEPSQVEQRHNSSSPRLSRQAASIRPETVAPEADSGNPDTMEDPDQIRAWARSNPEHAREWLASAPEGAKLDTVSEMVCLQIGETNPAAAAALADGYGRTNVLENLMMQWADQDIQAACRWAVAKPPGPQRDSLLSRIAFIEAKTYPEHAARLVAEQIPPGQIQDEAAISVLYQWAQKDSNAAMRWAQSFSVGALHDRAVNEVQNVMASN